MPARVLGFLKVVGYGICIRFRIVLRPSAAENGLLGNGLQVVDVLVLMRVVNLNVVVGGVYDGVKLVPGHVPLVGAKLFLQIDNRRIFKSWLRGLLYALAVDIQHSDLLLLHLHVARQLRVDIRRLGAAGRQVVLQVALAQQVYFVQPELHILLLLSFLREPLPDAVEDFFPLRYHRGSSSDLLFGAELQLFAATLAFGLAHANGVFAGHPHLLQKLLVRVRLLLLYQQADVLFVLLWHVLPDRLLPIRKAHPIVKQFLDVGPDGVHATGGLERPKLVLIHGLAHFFDSLLNLLHRPLVRQLLLLLHFPGETREEVGRLQAFLLKCVLLALQLGEEGVLVPIDRLQRLVRQIRQRRVVARNQPGRLRVDLFFAAVMLLVDYHAEVGVG